MFEKKTLVITSILVIGFSFQTCDPFGCNCPKPKGKYFDIQGINADNYKTRGECCADKVGPSEKVSLADYHLSVRYSIEYYSAQPVLPFLPKPSFSLINSAMACDCIENGILGSQERLQEFTVITLNDFDSQHLANDTINDLLTTSIYPDTFDLPTYLKTDTTFISQIDYVLKLKKKPTIDTEFKVKVNIKLKNGESYSSNSTPVIIQ